MIQTTTVEEITTVDNDDFFLSVILLFGLVVLLWKITTGDSI
jgi:hypothetical protein